MKTKSTRSRARGAEPAPTTDARVASPARATAREINPVWRAASVVAVTAMVVFSVVVRLQNLVSPLLEAHAFRQTQTAFTVWGFVNDGVSWLHAQLPVYGPPWEVPFEFPLFQAAAALVARVTRLDVDPACRLTNILFFYASAGLLYLICRKVSGRPGPAIAAVIVYLWSPFTIVWSRTSMIEYAAVAFALAYVLAILCWLGDERRRAWLVPVAIVFGCFGALVKITTMAITVPILLAFIWERFRKRDASASRRARIGWLVAVAVMLAVPVVVGQLWVMHTDRVKAASPVTSWLTSASLRDWNYGTIGQRLLAGYWATIAERVGTFVLPYAAAALPLAALAFWRRHSRPERLLLGSMLAGALFPILLFFNLYAVHDYYLCAITPCLAVLAGYGLHACFTRLPQRAAAGARALTSVALVASVWAAWEYVKPSFVVTYDASIYQFGLMVRAATPPDRHVLVMDTEDWDPTILYYARRKGLMYYQQSGPTPVDPDAAIPPEFLQTGGYATLVCRDVRPVVARLWPAHRQVGQLGEGRVIKLGPPAAGSTTAPAP